MCKGLFCIVTTLAAEKAMQHGGLHSHRLIPVPVNSHLPVSKQVETTVQKIYSAEFRSVFLKKLSIIVE